MPTTAIINLILGSVIPLNTANNQDNQGCGRCSPEKYASQIGNSSHHFSRRNLVTTWVDSHHASCDHQDDMEFLLGFRDP